MAVFFFVSRCAVENDFYVSIPAEICKAIPGQEDENGNYVFEVEASNENLDLQNQKILQEALLKSKEYFLSNGVVSDDHQHRMRNPDGTVETNKDKIIGEPVSIRTDGKRTFVKGILYGCVKAAKPFINLLKANSSRVKASVGGIMPKVRRNADGSETVTSFMWNDLALTTSPVNWTVGSASFAKSMSAADFCKALSAGGGTDSAEYTGGRALQNEDLEKQTRKIINATGGETSGEDSSDDLKKSEDDILREAVVCMKTGELKSRRDVEKFLTERGFDKDRARAKTLALAEQEENVMKKSGFSDEIDRLLKSFGGGSADDEEKKKKDGAGTLFDGDDDGSEPEKKPEEEPDDGGENSGGDDDDDGKTVKKGCVKKSQDGGDGQGDYLDVTELVKSFGTAVNELKAENEQLRKSLEETQEKMLDVTKSFSEYLKTPNERKTVMEKSLNGANGTGAAQQSMRPTARDFDVLKSALVKSARDGKISPEQVQFYNSEFQKSMNGQKISPAVWNDICGIVKANR